MTSEGVEPELGGEDGDRHEKTQCHCDGIWSGWEEEEGASRHRSRSQPLEKPPSDDVGSARTERGKVKNWTLRDNFQSSGNQEVNITRVY